MKINGKAKYSKASIENSMAIAAEKAVELHKICQGICNGVSRQRIGIRGVHGTAAVPSWIPWTSVECRREVFSVMHIHYLVLDKASTEANCTETSMGLLKTMYGIFDV